MFYRSEAGFTLVEATMVIIIFGIMALAATTFILGPVSQYTLLSKHAVIVDDGAFILQRLTRELRSAIPNTVRIKPSPGSKIAIEFIPMLQSVRYKRTSGMDEDILSFDEPDDIFSIIGNFSNATLAAQTAEHPIRLVIFQQNMYTPGETTDSPLEGVNLYNPTASETGAHVITPANTTVTFTNVSGTVGSVELSAPFQFALESPQQKMYLFDTTEAPITFLCDTEAGTLTRYWNYPITATQPNDPNAAPLDGALSALVSDRVASCTFTYEPGVSYRTGVVTVKLDVRGAPGEILPLIQQIQVPSSP